MALYLVYLYVAVPCPICTGRMGLPCGSLCPPRPHATGLPLNPAAEIGACPHVGSMLAILSAAAGRCGSGHLGRRFKSRASHPSRREGQFRQWVVSPKALG